MYNIIQARRGIGSLSLAIRGGKERKKDAGKIDGEDYKKKGQENDTDIRKEK